MSTTLTVEGMSCGHCEQTVEAAIEGVAGVRRAEADNSADQVSIDGDSDIEEVVAAVEAAGYDAVT